MAINCTTFAPRAGSLVANAAVREPDHVHRRRVPRRPARPAFQRRLNYLAIGDRLAQLVGAPKAGPTQRRPIVDGNIINSKGIHVGRVVGPEVFDLKGQKLYDLKGVNIYRLSGELIGHLADVRGAEKHLDKATDRLFPTTGVIPTKR